MGYPGNKNSTGLFQAIINQQPPHTVYIEPFLGSGAVMLNKRAAAVNIGVDLNRPALRAFASLVASPGTTVVDLPAGSPVPARSDRPASSTGTSSSLLASGSTRAPASLLASGSTRARTGESGRRGRPASLLASGSARARTGAGGHLQLFCADALRFLRQYPFNGSELVYCDPPYVHSTRESPKLYQHELTDEQHRELLHILVGLRARVILSGYWTSMYSRALKGWRSLTLRAMTRGGTSLETIWMNYAEPVELHDYTYIGDGWRERNRIRKKVRRWISKLDRMPLLERRALLAALAAASPPVAMRPDDPAA